MLLLTPFSPCAKINCDPSVRKILIYLPQMIAGQNLLMLVVGGYLQLLLSAAWAPWAFLPSSSSGRMWWGWKTAETWVLSADPLSSAQLEKHEAASQNCSCSCDKLMLRSGITQHSFLSVWCCHLGDCKYCFGGFEGEEGFREVLIADNKQQLWLRNHWEQKSWRMV